MCAHRAPSRYNTRMRILVTNDDGILSPGIEALVRAVEPLGSVEVVAPETEQSAIGHAITVKTPMSVNRLHVKNTFHGWGVDGRPADCVKLAVLELLDERPDFIVSGINLGANTGINVLYSGTVAGALEAAFFGIPSMAVSLELSDELDFRLAERITRSIFEHFVAARPRPGTCLNVNIPALDAGPPRGIRCCAQCTSLMRERYGKQTDSRGRSVYWLDGTLDKHAASPDSDLAAIRDGYVAITPLRFQMTDAARLAELTRWEWPRSFA